jgi:hypothetical protein
MPARIVSQSLTLGDYAMMAIVTVGTLAMMLAGGFARRRRPDPEPESSPVVPDTGGQLRRHYRTKWGTEP